MWCARRECAASPAPAARWACRIAGQTTPRPEGGPRRERRDGKHRAILTRYFRQNVRPCREPRSRPDVLVWAGGAELARGLRPPGAKPAELRSAGQVRTPAPTWPAELNARIRAMPKTSSAKARARKIKLLLFDVDGVLTDGKLFLFPVPTAGSADKPIVVEAKGFHAQDGAGISIARIAGIKTGLITRRNSETVALRARDLRLEHVHQGSQDKLKVFRQILADERTEPGRSCLRGRRRDRSACNAQLAVSVAVANARREVKRRITRCDASCRWRWRAARCDRVHPEGARKVETGGGNIHPKRNQQLALGNWQLAKPSAI